VLACRLTLPAAGTP